MSNSPLVIEGKAPFPFKGDSYETWYKVVGDLKGSTSGCPLVVLHGGPGIAHYYMLALSDPASKYGVCVVFYDQIGCGSSTHLKDKPKEFWTTELFGDELENLAQHLGIGESFDVLGHSWGGMLASTWAASRKPPGLRKLVLSDSPASTELLVECIQELVKGLPEETRKNIEKHERDGTTDSKEYQDAVKVYYARHVCRLPELPEMLAKSMQAIEEDPTVYLAMNGPAEFSIEGSLKTWSVIDELPNITQPTLLINGKYDQMQDACVCPLFSKIPKVKWVTFADSSHMPVWEERERYMQVINDFLAL